MHTKARMKDIEKIARGVQVVFDIGNGANSPTISVSNSTYIYLIRLWYLPEVTPTLLESQEDLRWAVGDRRELSLRLEYGSKAWSRSRSWGREGCRSVSITKGSSEGSCT